MKTDKLYMTHSKDQLTKREYEILIKFSPGFQYKVAYQLSVLETVKNTLPKHL